MRTKSGRGSVGRATRVAKKYESKEYKELKNKEKMIWINKNREHLREYQRKYREGLNRFANKRCKECKILLSHASTSGYCRKHRRRRK